jgi:Cu-Zn family superoxide dismutase
MCENAIAIINSPTVEGVITFHQCDIKEPTKVTFRLLGSPDQIHAIHLHEYGDVRDGCTSLGAHYNPSGMDHGSFLTGLDHHAGDLINNIQFDKYGVFNFEYDDPLINVRDIYGRSIVIHQDADDLGLGDNAESLRTGNAGKRIAYSIIGRTK